MRDGNPWHRKPGEPMTEEQHSVLARAFIYLSHRGNYQPESDFTKAARFIQAEIKLGEAENPELLA